MIKLKARGSESAEQLLRRFKKICEKEGLIREMKKHTYFEKPSIMNRRKRRQSVKRKIQHQRLGSTGF